jgi:septal ring factor EnvC (AmiA/AmiB activator)
MERRTLVILGIAVLSLLFVSKSLQFSMISFQGTPYTDEGPYKGLNGITYNHHITIYLESGEDRTSDGTAINSQRTKSIVIGHVFGDTIMINNRYRIEGTYYRYVSQKTSRQAAWASINFGDESFRTNLIKSNYNYYRGTLPYLVEKPVRYSGDSTIYIESIDIANFRYGCDSISCYNWIDMRPPSDWNIPCLITEEDIPNKRGYWSRAGECKITGFDYISRDQWDWYWKTYWYTGLLPDAQEKARVIIAFNVPDSDGDGVDDIDDIRPDNPEIAFPAQVEDYLYQLQSNITMLENLKKQYESDIASLQEQRDNLQKEIERKDDEINRLSTQIADLKKVRDDLNSVIQSLTTEKETLQSKVDELSIQIIQLEEQINKLSSQLAEVSSQLEEIRKLQKSLADEISASAPLLDSVSSNISYAIDQVTAFNNTLNDMQNIIESSSLSSSDKQSLVNYIDTLRTSSNNIYNTLIIVNRLIEEKKASDARILELSAELNARTEALGQTIEELQRTQKELVETKEKLKETEAKLNESVSTIEKLTKELEDTRDKLALILQELKYTQSETDLVKYVVGAMLGGIIILLMLRKNK